MCYKEEKQKELYIKFKEKVNIFPDFMIGYFSHLKSNVTKNNNLDTIEKYMQYLISNKIINKPLKDIMPEDLKALKEQDVINYLDSLKFGKSMKNTTVNTKMNIIRGLWSYLIENDYVYKNIVTKNVANKYKIKDKKVVAPTDEDVENLVKNLESNINNEEIALMYIAIVRLFAGSGIRLEELVGLDLKHLHFDDPKDRYIMVMEKGEQDELVKVNINQTAYFALIDYLKVRNIKPENKDREELFISSEGNRLAKKTIQEMIKKYSNGIIHPHSLRHYVGTKIYQNSGFDINQTKKQLRHKSVNTSIKYYVADDDEKLKDVLDTF